jgi:hypothetical protein
MIETIFMILSLSSLGAILSFDHKIFGASAMTDTALPVETAMSATPSRRDYSLIGRDAKLAVENGLSAAEWYHTDVSRKQMKELMKRNRPAIRDTIFWLGVLILSGAGGACSGPRGGACRSSSSISVLYGSPPIHAST